MTECWSEGELRAYLDRELPPEEMERMAAHLEECAECSRISAELGGRAGFVAELMGSLAVPEAAPRRSRSGWRWAVAAAALAAGIAIGALVKHQPAEPQAAVTTAPVIETPAATVLEAPAAAPERSEQLASAPVRRPPPRRAARTLRADNAFMALDDEPFETGVVLRMALGPREVPADVVFGPDGRARAVRLVNYK
jgi:anti-sigma factor RsiW